ncbi:MAG: MBL fold metallo-hydrolase [Anaerolineales bacterium]|nr:MBL fold metallo-hydrolase [Anaerolineales bacterium]
MTVTIRSTHHYLVETGSGYLMVDSGWAGGLPALRGQLKRYQIELAHIRYVMITHHHPDHAGLTQEIKQASQARLIILEQQIPFLENLKAFYAGKGGYTPIRVEASDLVLSGSTRTALARIGVQGEIVETPGHSDDSVSLVLDSGNAFVGDLRTPDLVPDEAREATCRSWRALLQRNVKTIYPAHTDPFPLDNVRATLAVC